MFNLQIRLLLIALRVWSRFPGVARIVPAAASDERFVRSLRYAPAVGILVAIPAALVYAIAGLWLPHPVSVLGAMACAMLLTGTLHERAFAALCDGLGARRDPVRAREAMRDVHRGSMASVGITMLLLARVETLSSIDPSWIAVTLICSAAISRGCAVAMLATLDQAPESAPDGDHGEASARTGPAGLDLGIAIGWSTAPLLAAIAWTGDAGVFIAGGALAAIATLLLRRQVARRLDGHTRECFGGAQQIAELAFQLGVLATLSIADETLADPSS
ncbi:MAG: adenosylcobinamide-GDP ribazoletransferase [Pseudomonadota bacterium]